MAELPAAGGGCAKELLGFRIALRGQDFHGSRRRQQDAAHGDWRLREVRNGHVVEDRPCLAGVGSRAPILNWYRPVTSGVRALSRMPVAFTR